VVTAEPVPETEQRSPTAFSVAIDPARHAEEVETLAEALAEAVGVQVRRFGGLGAFSTVSIRGVPSNQVQFFLDGIPLSRARNDVVNLADLPLDVLERIEVYRSTAPVRFGAGAIGGVVNLVTRRPSDQPHTEASAFTGSFGTRKVVLTHTRRAGRFGILASASYLGSEGDFPFRDDRGTKNNPRDDKMVDRRNNAFDSVDALFRVTADVGAARLDWTSETFFKDQGVPGPASPQFLTPSLAELRVLNYARLVSPALVGGRLEVEATAFGIYERERFDDRSGEFGLARIRRNATTVVGGSTGGTVYPGRDHTVNWLFEATYEHLASVEELATPASEPGQTRFRASGGLQDEVRFLGDRLALVPALRYEHLRDTMSASFDLANRPRGPRRDVERDLWSPGIGLCARLQPWLELRGNLGRFHRAPNFSELFGVRGSVQGRADLRPEKGVNRDIGLVAAPAAILGLRDLRAEYVYFDNDAEDLIVLTPVSPRAFRPENVSAARLRGHELSLKATAEVAGWELNYTHLDAQDRSPIPARRGNQLPGRPADELYTRFDLFHRWGSVYYEFNFVSGNFLDPANFQRVPSRDLHTLGLHARWGARLRLTFEVRNLTDNQVRDAGDFPLPGRAFFGGVQARL